jgi:hypothetical protein
MQRKPPLNTGKTLDDVIMAAKDEQIKAIERQPKKKTHQEENDPDKLRRQTYYITELYIKAIEQMAFYEKMDKSEIVRAALEEYVPQKYLKLALTEKR